MDKTQMSWLDVDDIDNFDEEDLKGEGYGPDPDGLLLEWLVENPGWHPRGVMLKSLGLWDSVWRDSIQRLVRSGIVERTGRGRATRYRLDTTKTLRIVYGMDEAAVEGTYGEDEHVVFLDEDPDVFFLNSGIDYDPDEDHFNFCADMLVEWFIANPGWYSREEILASGVIPAEEWRDAIAELVNDGHVERKGRGRKARYRLIPEAGDHLLLDWLQEHPGWHKRADVLADIGQWLKAPEWRRAIRRLVDMGVVKRTGRSAGTRYRAVPLRT